jgi:hypothetical protein
MSEVTRVLPDFPGFGIQYDPSAHPFFESIMVENLRKLQEVALGRALLDSIHWATPRSRGTFPDSVNVMCVPQDITLTQSGYKMGFVGESTDRTMIKTQDKRYKPKGCPFWLDGTSSCEPFDQLAADNGNGTVCFMNFSNAQIFTNKGEKADPYIVLAHELIHSLHCLSGNRTENPDEDSRTIGLGKWVNEALSENAIRTQYRLPLRSQF